MTARTIKTDPVQQQMEELAQKVADKTAKELLR